MIHHDKESCPVSFICVFVLLHWMHVSGCTNRETRFTSQAFVGGKHGCHIGGSEQPVAVALSFWNKFLRRELYQPSVQN
jgi:hypothetical protein